jgi:hypothetical protein
MHRKYPDLHAILNGKRKNKKIKIKVRAGSLSGALEALDQTVVRCSMSDDEHTRVIDAAYWSSDILKAVEKRTRWWKKK